MFTENLEPETVMPFLEPLMTRLVQMLQTPKRGVKVRSRVVVVVVVVVVVLMAVPWRSARSVQVFLPGAADKFTWCCFDVGADETSHLRLGARLR